MKDLFKALFRVPLVLPLLAVALTGCGSNLELPTGASPASGATIQGTVNGGASAAGEGVRSFSGSGANLRVTVVGTSLQTTTDASGRFTIEGVPSGDVVLRFQGSGVDATVRIQGLVAGQVLTITVEVNGSQAALVPPGQQKTEFSGVVESIAPPELRVSGRRVVTNAGTEIERGDTRIALTALQVGETVRVEGTLQSDGGVLAREIKANAPRETELSGVIQSINAPTFQVGGRTVMTDSATKFKGNGRIQSLADLRVGDRVEVKGTMRADGSLLASEVKREDEDDDDDDDDDEAELKGRIESISAPNLQVAGRTVRTDASTRIERRGRRASLGDLRVGDRVEVKGVRRADGSILASRIEVED